ncbi:hypothetical protein L6164_018661 [Bauhinia variegata]|uniref:Uncharacterized protein n=1 Tax=Bauhinia variegata TaxID=167791 RepID=A0ACB9NDM9_BAUVA|nr:hypothetical protein L6164_018661 [Bauhinia variegata]
MDVKALAKSKRAHSQHHSKKPHGCHPNQKHKAPSSSDAARDAGTAKKPLGKQVKENTHCSQGSSGLPSNWDRYEDEFDSGPEGIAPDIASKLSDVVLPKSKGADFRYLVAEAQSQSNASLDGFPSLDDVLPGEFNEGLGSMLAVRGESILSWIGEDNFIVEDKTSGTHEVPFLSLNLHALAESLEKVDLSKRLFIEPDLLPPELCAVDSAAGSNQEPDKMQTTEDSELARMLSEELALDDFAIDVKIINQFTSSSSSGSSHSAAPFTLSKGASNPFTIPAKYVDVESEELSPSAEVNINSTEDPSRKSSTFTPAAAEEELDMLLDSFRENKILDSSGFSSNTSFPVSQGVTSVDPPQITIKEPDSSKSALITASLDDERDDLLEETSTMINSNGLLRPKEENTVLHSTQSSDSGTKSKVLNDFDSWLDTI